MAVTPCILIVDDEENQRKNLSYILKKKGYQVESAGTGKEALEKAGSRTVSLTLLDINLPDTDGLELVAPLKATNPDMTIIIITGFASVENSVHSLNAGVSEYLIKPFNPDDLLAKIRDSLERQDLIREKREAKRALLESEERYRSLFENANEGIFFADIETMEFVHANPAICKMLGYSKEELITMRIADIHPKESLDYIFREFQKLARDETGVVTDIPCQRKDGTIRMMNIASSRVMMPGRMCIVGFFTDITERKEAEGALKDFNKKLQQGIEEKTATLRESELRHSRLFESSRDAIMTLEPPDWRFTSGNPATVTMFRAEDEACFTSKGPWDLSPEYQPDGRPSGEMAKEQIETAMREGSNYFEWTHKRLDGEEFPTTVLLTRFEWKGKEILQATVRDITKQKQAEEGLKNSERKFRAIFDQTFQFIGLMTPDGTLVEANRTAVKFSGIQESEILGKPFWETPWWTHSGELQEKLRAAVQDAAQGEFVRFEATHPAADGSLRYIDFSIKPVMDEAGHVVLLIPEGRDITERKRAEEALHDSEAKFRTLFESADDAIFIMNSTVFLDCNQSTERMFGSSRDKIIGHAPAEFSPEQQSDGQSSAKKAQEKIAAALSGEPQSFEWVHLHPDGTPFTVEVTLNRILLNGEYFLQAIARDTTRRKQAEEALHLFRDLVKHSTDAIGISTPGGRHYYQNEAFDRMFDGIRDDAPETVYVDKAIGKQVFDTIIGGGCWQGEVKMFRKDGIILDIFLRAYAIKNPDDRVIGLVGLHTDITEQKRTEDKIRVSLDEKVILLREIHHRVKNNLQIIISLVNLQMRQIEDKRLKQVMAETQNRVRAMAFVHEKLYKSEDIAHIDLASYTRFLVTQLFSFYGVDSRQVILNIDIEKIMVGINTSIPLGLIINELANNALKHAFSNGKTGSLSITVRKKSSTLHLTVKDDGVGVPADFDWRHAESLGLQLVISLVEQLDGTIELDRSAGTAFTIVVQEKE